VGEKKRRRPRVDPSRSWFMSCPVYEHLFLGPSTKLSRVSSKTHQRRLQPGQSLNQAVGTWTWTCALASCKASKTAWAISQCTVLGSCLGMGGGRLGVAYAVSLATQAQVLNLLGNHGIAACGSSGSGT